MRHRRQGVLVAAMAAALAGLLTLVLSAGAAPPVPHPLVKVVTKSGDVTRTTLVPIGGLPVPIDVDDGGILGLAKPDIDVSVGVVALSELPGKPLVPNIIIARHPLAPVRRAAAPPLHIDAEIVLLDPDNGLQKVAEIHYGYTTPPGGRIPPVVRAKLVGPLQTGFLDPLEAIVEAPGYGGALDLHVNGVTPGKTFDLGFDYDPMPSRIHVVEDPRDDGQGHDVLYEHEGPDPDVDLYATAKFVTNDDPIEIDARIERLPKRIEAHVTTTDEQTLAEYAFDESLAKPDLEAHVLDETKEGALVNETRLRAAGLAPELRAQIDYRPDGEGGREADTFDVLALDGGQIDRVELESTNQAGTPLPLQELGPDQQLAVTTRQGDDGTKRYRLAARVEQLRHVHYEKVADTEGGVSVQTDIGDGVKPLRAVLDLDERGPGAPPGASLFRLDAMIRPLPKTVTATYLPPANGKPLTFDYLLSDTADADAVVRTAEGSGSECGEALVTCATVNVRDVPTTLHAEIAEGDVRDYRVTHSGAGDLGDPDVDATVDATPADTAKRTWAEVRAEDVPKQVRARVDVRDDVLRVAEFHACNYDFGDEECSDAEGAIGRVAVIARPAPDRAHDLPADPLGPGQHVTYVRRDADYEATAQAKGVKHLVFRQRDALLGDGKADGVYGVFVEAGAGERFDARVDTEEGPDETELDLVVNPLPASFEACVQRPLEGAAAEGKPLPDSLLNPCETAPPVAPAEDEPSVRPLVARYVAAPGSAPTVTTRLRHRALDEGTPVTTVARSRIVEVPDVVKVAVVPPISPEDGADARRLQARYDATEATGNQQIEEIDVDIERRVGTAVCGDPRPHTDATCVKATLENIPRKLTAVYEPSETDPSATFTTEPQADDEPLSIKGLTLSSVEPKEDDEARKVLVMTGDVLAVPRALKATIAKRQLEPGEKLAVAAVLFDACHEQPDDCPGIGTVDLQATNQLAGDVLPHPEPMDPEPEQRLELAQSGDQFRAAAKINNLRRVALSRLEEDGDPSATTRIAANFGTGDAQDDLRAFVHRDLGSSRQVADAIVLHAPKELRICFRPPLLVGEQPADGDGPEPFCAKQEAGATAVQAVATGGQIQPTIVVRDLELARGPSVIAGTARIQSLAERVDVLFSRGDGKGPRLSIEGHDADDGPGADPKPVAGRITFDLANHLDELPSNRFPARPLDEGTPDPASDSRNFSPGAFSGHNYVELLRDGDRMSISGSVPGLRRVAFAPEPCIDDENRFPTTLDGEIAPAYTCINALGPAGRPLGIALRTRDEDDNIVAFDDASITELPAGDDGLRLTLARSPETAADLPLCTEHTKTACRPPVVSVVAPRSEQQPDKPVLQGRFAKGVLSEIERLRDNVPSDSVSALAQLDASPRDYEFDDEPVPGVRAKVGLGGEEIAIRAGMRLALPKHLEIDPVQVFRCDGDFLGQQECDGVANPDTNFGQSALNLRLRVVGSDDAPYGTDIEQLGRMAVYVKDFGAHKPGAEEGKRTELMLTGTTPPPPKPRGTEPHPYESPPEGEHQLGFLMPGYFDVAVYKRDEFENPGHDQYVQLDGRFNEPLSLALHDNSRGPGFTRSGAKYLRIPGRRYALHNAPGLDDDHDTFANPTFRLRTTMRKDHTRDKGVLDCETHIGADLTAHGLPGFCVIVSQPELRWLDVSLNARPRLDEPAARLVEAVVDRRSKFTVPKPAAGNNVHARAYSSSTYDKKAEGVDNADAQRSLGIDAGLRLVPFDIGLRLGIGIGFVGTSRDVRFHKGDLILAANAVGKNVLLRQRAMTLRASTDGELKAVTDYEAAVRFRWQLSLLFGLFNPAITITDAHRDVPIRLLPCSVKDGVEGAIDSLEVESATVKTSIFPAGGAGAKFKMATFPILASLMPVFACMHTNPERSYVTENDPQPPFDIVPPNHVPDGVIVLEPAEPPDDPEPPKAPPDLIEVKQDTTMCGTVEAREFVVHPGATLDVGNELQQVNSTVDGQDVTTVCDGSLTINAERITVHEGGAIGGGGARITGPGTPKTGVGGGAGHVFGGGGAGDGDLGPGGPSYGQTEEQKNEGELPFGSPGRAGGETVSGGRGGGRVRLLAEEAISIAGIVSARGFNGEAAEACEDGLSGGGGGSGGSLQIAAPRVTLAESGVLRAMGGEGGDGGHGGGGGAGGRIQIDTIVDNIAGERLADSGEGGEAEQDDCKDGNKPPFPGLPTLGKTATVGAAATRPEPQPEMIVADDVVPLRLEAVRKDGGALTVVACPRHVPPDDPDEFASAGLNPPQDEPLVEGCTSHFFPDANTDAHGYRATEDAALPHGDGYYGFYAMAYVPPDPEDPATRDCRHPEDGCALLGGVPPAATAFVGSDTTPPQVTGVQITGDSVEGCGVELCTSDDTVTAEVEISDPMSGLEKGACLVDGKAVTESCGPGAVSIPVTAGMKSLAARLTDAAGNQGVEPLATVLVDRSPPARPEIEVEGGTQESGWYTAKPELTISASDGGQSSIGFGEDPIELLVDGSPVTCGTVEDDTATCTPDELADLVPTDGTHTFQAQAIDRLGNRSALSDADPDKPGDQPVTLQLDSEKPQSRLFLGPDLEDQQGWLTTKPVFAFAMTDTPGGSGVELGTGKSRLRYSLNDGAWQDWNPANPNATLPDGVHDICWRATDVAGNEEELDPVHNCRTDIRVDSTPPALSMLPGAPEGEEGWYHESPTVVVHGSDLAPGSGVQHTEYRLDDGQWTQGDKVEIPEGHHVLRARSMDSALNVSPVREQRFRVDLKDPSASLPSYPPLPNVHGWFRQSGTHRVTGQDVPGGSGLGSARFALDANDPLEAFEAPFAVPEGTHALAARTRDVAAREGLQTGRVVRVDTTAPIPIADGSLPAPLLLPGQTTALRFNVSDTLTPQVKVRVHVLNLIGQLVQTLPAPGDGVDGYRPAGAGEVLWDGRNSQGKGVLPGTYFYRVHALDQAGNAALSSEGGPIVVALSTNVGGLPETLGKLLPP